MPGNLYEVPNEDSFEAQDRQGLLGRAAGWAIESTALIAFATPAVIVESTRYVTATGINIAKKAVKGTVAEMSNEDFLTVDPDQQLVDKIKTRRKKVEKRIVTPEVKPTS